MDKLLLFIEPSSLITYPLFWLLTLTSNNNWLITKDEGLFIALNLQEYNYYSVSQGFLIKSQVGLLMAKSISRANTAKPS